MSEMRRPPDVLKAVLIWAISVLIAFLALMIGTMTYRPSIPVTLALFGALVGYTAAGGIFLESYRDGYWRPRPAILAAWVGLSLTLLAGFGLAIFYQASPWMVLALAALFSVSAMSLPAILRYIGREMRQAEESSPQRVLERMNRAAAQWKD